MALLDVNWNPDRKELRLFGGIYLPIFLLIIGGLLYYKYQLRTASVAVACAALAISALGWAAPTAAKPLYLMLVAATYPIGWTLSHLVMAIIYYLVLTPIGILLRLVGHDPLCRSFEPTRQTYWVERRPPEHKGRYFRQF